MKVIRSERGFEFIMLQPYGEGDARLVSQSSAIGDYPDSLARPGTSYLWVGDHQLDREAVREFVSHLNAWLETGSLEVQ